MDKYIYLLDYSYGGILEIELDKEDAENLEETNYATIDNILRKYGIRENDCSYMLSENKLEIETIEKIERC